jgi:hypothetical protein
VGVRFVLRYLGRDLLLSFRREGAGVGRGPFDGRALTSFPSVDFAHGYFIRPPSGSTAAGGGPLIAAAAS